MPMLAIQNPGTCAGNGYHAHSVGTRIYSGSKEISGWSSQWVEGCVGKAHEQTSSLMMSTDCWPQLG